MSDAGWLITPHDVWDDVIALFDFPGEFLPVRAGMPLSERFNAIRHNYKRKQAMVDAGLDEWFRGDPYDIAPWPELFTPIEYALWFDIRGRGLDLWPQLPVGRFFADFGNPVARIVVECDGKEFHRDTAKDCARDQEMEAMGWTVVRIPGWQCNRQILTSAEAQEKHGISEDEYESWRDRETPYTSLEIARERLDSCRRRLRERAERRGNRE
jgi:very-short-patch-repair endonuclease